MGYVRGLPAALAARGLTVELVPGWETRGSESFNPRGAVCHWTAGARTGDRPSLAVVRDGRTGLPGPLANVFLTRGGVAIVVAAGRANHAGEGGWRGLEGNSSVFGTEAESSGTGDWTAEQRWAYPRVNAAFCDLGGFGPEMVCGHSEWAPNRKIDIRDWDMPAMRAQVTAVLAGGNDMPSLDQQDLINILEASFTITQAGEKRQVSLKEALGAIILYGDRIVSDVSKVPKKVWDHEFEHTLTGKPVTAGAIQRYEPAEHAKTRAVLEAAIVASVSRIPGTDPELIKRLVAEGVAEGIASIETTVTIEKG